MKRKKKLPVKMAVFPFKRGYRIRKYEGRFMLMDSKYYNTQELAAVLNMSVVWVEKWRAQIVGARQVGRRWRFDRAIIDARIAKGQDVRDLKKSTAPRSRKYISSVHGAARSNHTKGDTQWH